MDGVSPLWGGTNFSWIARAIFNHPILRSRVVAILKSDDIDFWTYAIRFAEVRTEDPWCERTMANRPVRTVGSILGQAAMTSSISASHDSKLGSISGAFSACAPPCAPAFMTHL